MKLTFNIDYRTNWGEAVYITSPLGEMGAGDYDKAVKMRLIGDGTWQAVVEVPDNTPDFVYRYFIRHENGYVKTNGDTAIVSTAGAAPRRMKYSTDGRTSPGTNRSIRQYSPSASTAERSVTSSFR